MASFLLIRLLRWSVGLLLILFVTYAMMYYGAGDPIRMMFIQGEDFDTEDEAVMRALRAKYGLDEPFIVQFGNYLNNLVRGDWGRSIRLQVDRPVLEIVQFRLPISMQLGFAATVIAAALPVAVIAIGPLPGIVRQTRSAMLEVKGQQYVTTARAKGVPESRIILRHMLRPVMTPVVTTLGLIMIALINGSLFVELIYNIPGFGLLTIEGIRTVDYPIIMSVAVVGTLIIFISNFVVDMIYPILDPRVRVQ